MAGAIVQMQVRRGTAAGWTSANPTLLSGEIGYETDTGKFKVGDGSTTWTGLSYAGTAGPTGATGPAGASGLSLFGIHDDPDLSEISWPTPYNIPNIPAIGYHNEMRLSLTSGSPITPGNVTAATTIYYTPCYGNRTTVFDVFGNPAVLVSPEISIAVPATTATGYDVWVYNNSGVLALELLAWTNVTTRATATVRTTTGALTKSGDLTRRYVGSFLTTGVSGQTEDSETSRYLYNEYNWDLRTLLRFETTASWASQTGAFVQANASSTNQINLFVGQQERTLTLAVSTAVFNGTAGITIRVGIGEDSTTTIDAACQEGLAYTGSSLVTPIRGILIKKPAVGKHFYSWNNNSLNSGTAYWYGANSSGWQFGLTGSWPA